MSKEVNVKIRFFGKEVILIVCLIFLFSALTLAQGKEMVTMAGQVMDLNVVKKTVTVNEKTFVWDPNTLFYDENNSPTTADKLKNNVKVHIEATWIKNKPYIIKKLYLLPPK